MSEEIKKYDKNNNLIYYKDGWEYWYEYDENNNCIYFRSSSGYEFWKKYDENNNCIYYKDFDNQEHWYKYDNRNNPTHITKQEFENIKIKEHMNREKCSRFELMEI